MDDLISRQAAIDALNKLARKKFTLAYEYEIYLGALHEAADDIRGLPSAQPERCENCVNFSKTRLLIPQPEQQWIPCSERLPEASGRYLVTRGLNACGALWNRVYIANYSDLMGLKREKIFWSGNVGKSDFERLEDVKAWMPLPEPYREEGGER